MVASPDLRKQCLLSPMVPKNWILNWIPDIGDHVLGGQVVELADHVEKSQIKSKTIRVQNIYRLKRNHEWDAFTKDIDRDAVTTTPFRELWMRDGLQTFHPLDTLATAAV